MPSEAPLHGTQTEKPQHYMYLKEFRTQQCPLFVQHKCTQHRPFTCFHWHFLNQRRRRPVKKREGTFNYSPDIYCSKYDESSGICPDGDDCPFLHRTAGDTERRYHLRYYKTGTCVYETDSRGNCVKNGPHCAFAHGANDIRPPVFDKSEVQGIELLEKTHDTSMLSTTPTSSSGSSLTEKEKMPAEDPKWNDTNFVLANYKTEQCKRPPRLCRQGYACPHFHNVRDRRRSPKQFKYRSTPCPNVKHGDEWSDPTQCENGDSCVYCHTRTEQQFHPEIYKSTKCNDMVQTGTCPRGAFCAFAHVEHEMTSERDVLATTENSLAAFVTSALPNSVLTESAHLQSDTHSDNKEQNGKTHHGKLPDPIGKERANSSNNMSLGLGSMDAYNKGRSGSVSSSISSDFGSGHSYHRAPGSEREDSNVKLRQQLQAIENELMLDNAEKARRKEALILQHTMGAGGLLGVGSRPLYSPVSQHPPQGMGLGASSMSPHAPAFYPPGNTVESVVGKALDDLNMEDFDITSIDRELDRERDNDTNSVSSSLSAGLSTSGAFSTSGPIGIPPGTLQQRGSISSLSQSPPSPFGSLTHSNHILQLHRDAPHDQSSSPLLGHSVLGKYHGYGDSNLMSPRSGGPHSPSLFPPSGQQGLANSNGTSSEVQRLRDELNSTKSKMAEWEGVYNQAKCACEAWRKEAEECTKRAKAAEEEKQQIVKQRDEAMSQAQRLRQDGSFSPYLRCIPGMQELEAIPVEALQQLRHQLQIDLNTIDQVIYRKLQQRQVSS
ncbi:RING finger protein unkempt homolog [Littorina saxatilis]|uniref:C3H1-type domain-containing protein n=1 Tax=Littorina saxatilis TaxID=31220 RepID=A0AAN9GMJ6_9CAEN